MKKISFKKKIKELLKKRKAILLAHNYQRDEIQELADITGDSLELSQKALETKAEVIVFCGVLFMAESASILSPDKTVLLPVRNAGCFLADNVTVESLRNKKAEYPEAEVVCYINSSAEIKAESDICCTSANAIKVVNSLKGVKQIIMLPDQNLAKYVAKYTDKEIIPWLGYCDVHQQIEVEDILRAKEEHPKAKLMAHPECKPEVLAFADHVCSTSGMYKYAKGTSHTEFIVGTEMGVLYRLKKENPYKKFYTPSKDIICRTMKLTKLEDIINALESMEYMIRVSEDIRFRAKKSLDKMLEIS